MSNQSSARKFHGNARKLSQQSINQFAMQQALPVQVKPAQTFSMPALPVQTFRSAQATPVQTAQACEINTMASDYWQDSGVSPEQKAAALQLAARMAQPRTMRA